MYNIFRLIHSNKRTIKFYEFLNKKTTEVELCNDQAYFNKFSEEYVKNNELSIHKISIHDFGIGLSIIKSLFFSDLDSINILLSPKYDFSSF